LPQAGRLAGPGHTFITEVVYTNTHFRVSNHGI